MYRSGAHGKRGRDQERPPSLGGSLAGLQDYESESDDEATKKAKMRAGLAAAIAERKKNIELQRQRQLQTRHETALSMLTGQVKEEALAALEGPDGEEPVVAERKMFRMKGSVIKLGPEAGAGMQYAFINPDDGGTKKNDAASILHGRHVYAAVERLVMGCNRMDIQVNSRVGYDMDVNPQENRIWALSWSLIDEEGFALVGRPGRKAPLPPPPGRPPGESRAKRPFIETPAITWDGEESGEDVQQRPHRRVLRSDEVGQDDDKEHEPRNEAGGTVVGTGTTRAAAVPRIARFKRTGPTSTTTWVDDQLLEGGVPDPLPAGWKACVDDATERQYFFNVDTGETTWTWPPPSMIDLVGEADEAEAQQSSSTSTTDIYAKMLGRFSTQSPSEDGHSRARDAVGHYIALEGTSRSPPLAGPRPYAFGTLAAVMLLLPLVLLRKWRCCPLLRHASTGGLILQEPLLRSKT